MAITNAQQYKQLVNPPMKGKKRPGYRGDDAARSDAASGRDAGRADPSGGVERGGGRDPTAQFKNLPKDYNLKKDNPDAFKKLTDQRKEARYQITPSTRPRNRVISGLLGIFGPPLAGFAFNKAIDRTAMGFNTPTTNPDDDDDTGGGDNDNFRETMIARQFTPYQQDIVEEKVEELSPIALALRQRDEMGGARAFAKEGGIMDLETGRQMYFLGKLVKKVKRGVKKIVKSPIGKTALAAAGIFKLGGGSFTDLIKGRGSGFDFSNIPGSSFLSNMDKEDALKLAAGVGLTAAPLLLSEDDTEDEYQKFLASRGASGQGLDIQGIRNDPYAYLGRAFVAEGGKPEPVAKKTLPLLDMGGQEMDLRAEGGFVPIGRMEKADDVPARLSKNEFVFTADAVRNAGEGDVDKGAEVMYNMMKNLESGGEVSEESQGLDGARRMFQTSQRLEEVL